MKNTLCRITGILALAFLATTQPARGQEAVLANIPFAFTAGEMTLPAGEYRVEKLQTGTGSPLVIQRTDYGATTIVMSNAMETNKEQEHSKLVFRRYANRYFLAQVWAAGSSEGRELPTSAKEKEQALAAHNKAPEQVTIVARFTPSNH